MALITGYYNSLNGDRKYNADKMSMYFSGLFTRGVLQNYKEKFIVTANGGMKIKIPTGKAFFSDGKWIENTAQEVFTLDPSDVVLNRIDRIVLRSDKGESVRNATILLKKGTPASSPIAPALQNDDYIEELSLATIVINKLVETITQANITNTIPDNSVCGYVTGLIDQVDTSDLYIQYETAYKEFKEYSEKEFNDWFSTLQEKLSTSTLLRQYTNSATTTIQNQKVVSIGIPQYEPALDILNVYVNNLWLIEGKDYSKKATEITLTLPLDINQDVYFSVFKSIDGEKAITVIEQVEKLQKETADLKTETIDLKANKANKKWYKAVLMVEDWNLNTSDNYYHCNVPVSGVGENDILIVSPDPQSVEKYAGVYANSQSTDYIDFKSKTKPTEAIYVNILDLGLGVLS